jgi:hypothetical protein
MIERLPALHVRTTRAVHASPCFLAPTLTGIVSDHLHWFSQRIRIRDEHFELVSLQSIRI